MSKQNYAHECVRSYGFYSHFHVDWEPQEETKTLVEVARSRGLGVDHYAETVDYWCWKLAGVIAQCDPDRPDDAEEYDAYYDELLSEAERLADEITSHGLHEQIAF